MWQRLCLFCVCVDVPNPGCMGPETHFLMGSRKKPTVQMSFQLRALVHNNSKMGLCNHPDFPWRSIKVETLLSSPTKLRKAKLWTDIQGGSHDPKDKIKEQPEKRRLSLSKAIINCKLGQVYNYHRGGRAHLPAKGETVLTHSSGCSSIAKAWVKKPSRHWDYNLWSTSSLILS